MHAMGTTSIAMLALHGQGRSRTKYASASCSQQPLGRQDTFFHAKHGRRRRVDGGADSRPADLVGVSCSAAPRNAEDIFRTVPLRHLMPITRPSSEICTCTKAYIA